MVPSHLVFERDGLLMAVPFDLEHLEVTGTPFALEPDVLVAYRSGAPAANSGAAQFDVSPAGMGRVRADGSAPPEDLRERMAFPHSVTPDGKTLSFQTTSAESGSDIWAMALAGDRTPSAVLHSQANEAWAEISPDGRWLAYGSDSSGRAEVYVEPFPAGGSRQQVSLAATRRSGVAAAASCSSWRAAAGPVSLS